VTGDDSPVRLTHRQVTRIAMAVWGYVEICRFFTLAIEDAAICVHGCVEPDYPLETGLAIVKAFSNTWQGCPTEVCDGNWTPIDIEAGRHEQ